MHPLLSEDRPGRKRTPGLGGTLSLAKRLNSTRAPPPCPLIPAPAPLVWSLEVCFSATQRRGLRKQKPWARRRGGASPEASAWLRSPTVALLRPLGLPKPPWRSTKGPATRYRPSGAEKCPSVPAVGTLSGGLLVLGG